jgi:short/branched chain acyl-CoA dehydrogenase
VEFRPGPAYSKAGWCASDTRELSFADCRVPAANLLGERGRPCAPRPRPGLRGRVHALRQRADLLRHAHRPAPGGRVQARRHDRAGVHAARLAWYAAAARPVAGAPFRQEAAIARLLASPAAMDKARDATQIFGGAGFVNESPVGRYYRDATIGGDRRGYLGGSADAHRASSRRQRARGVASVSVPFLSRPALARGSLRSASQAIRA